MGAGRAKAQGVEMNIELLKYFYMIAKEGNISGVAKAVHLSQSALSQQLQRLENEFGNKLLVRSNKGVALTPAGETVYKYAENILRTYDKMVGELEEAEARNVSIHIEACHSVADYALPCTMITAGEKYPGRRYALTGNRSAEIVVNVANNICDIGFVCDPQVNINDADIVAKKVGVNSIVLVGNAEEDLPEAMDVDSLLNSCLITFTDKNNITNIFLENLSKRGYSQSSINCNLRVESIEGAKMLIARKFGIAFLPYIAVKEELYKKQFKMIKIPDFDMNIDIVMLHKKGCASHVQDFVDWFADNGSKSFC